MHRFLRLLIPSLLLTVSSQATVILNTGQSGPDDPIWVITAGGSGPAQVIANPITIANGGPWANPPANAAWVSTTTDDSLPDNASYTISTTFTGGAGDYFTFRALADNTLTVRIDGIDVYTFTGTLASDFSIIPPPQTVTLGFTGTHTIDLQVSNVRGYSGVLLLTETPEPGTFLIAGLALAGLGLIRVRKQHA